MYTGDLVLPGAGESGEIVREKRKISPQRTQSSLRRKKKINAEFAESAEGAERSGFLFAVCCLLFAVCCLLVSGILKFSSRVRIIPT